MAEDDDLGNNDSGVNGGRQGQWELRMSGSMEDGGRVNGGG